jgi:hypothetical protein
LIAVPTRNTLLYRPVLEASIAMGSASVKLSELRDAFDFVDAGMAAGIESAAYICLDTGKISWESEAVDEEDRAPDDAETSVRYVAVPNKSLLRLGRNLALSFVEEAAPGDHSKVVGFFKRRGAYGRFKDLLESRGLLQQWYDFENSATERALREWCKENDIALIED